MKRNTRRLMEMAGIVHRSELLTEQEDDDDLFGGGDEEEEGDDEEAAEDEGDEEGEDEEGEDTGEEEEPEEPPEKLSAQEIAELGPGEIDQELDNVLGNIFDDSKKAAQAKIQSENIHRHKLSSLLFEAEDYATFDMARYTQETARLINHYDTQLDIEGMLYNKAKQFLLDNFGDDSQTAVDDFEDHMARVHGIDLTDKFNEEPEQPVAVGTGGEGGAA